MDIYIGTDPEVFLKDKTTGRFVSAHGQFPGTKDMPFPLGNYGFMQVDGHALEFNSHPAATEDEFVENVTNIFNAVKDEVYRTNPNWEIALEPVAEFDPEYFEALPSESKVLGCTPDYSSETGEVLSSPDIATVPLRTSSGHIHIGWTSYDDAFDDLKFKERLEIARSVTPHLLSVASKWETPSSIERRKYYGREGAFRPKHYGVELRALDCLWLADEQRMREVFRTAVDSFKEVYHAG